MNEATYVYIVHSDINENNIYAEFATEEEAIDYARRHKDELTYVDKVEVALDEDGEIIEMFDSETIWVYDEEDDFELEEEVNEFDTDFEEGVSLSEEALRLNKEEETEFYKLCKEIGIEDWGDIDNFKKEVGCTSGTLLQALRDYRAELGPDFEIKEEIDFDKLVEELEEHEDIVECKECYDLVSKESCHKNKDGKYVCEKCAKDSLIEDTEKRLYAIYNDGDYIGDLEAESEKDAISKCYSGAFGFASSDDMFDAELIDNDLNEAKCQDCGGELKNNKCTCCNRDFNLAKCKYCGGEVKDGKCMYCNTKVDMVKCQYCGGEVENGKCTCCNELVENAIANSDLQTKALKEDIDPVKYLTNIKKELYKNSLGTSVFIGYDDEGYEGYLRFAFDDEGKPVAYYYTSTNYGDWNSDEELVDNIEQFESFEAMIKYLADSNWLNNEDSELTPKEVYAYLKSLDNPSKVKQQKQLYDIFKDGDYVGQLWAFDEDDAVNKCYNGAFGLANSDDMFEAELAEEDLIEVFEEEIKMTRDELMDKEGTDDVELINAGRPEEERVELVEK